MLTPTIVIGIGGSAGKALQRLRLRIADRLGGVGALRAFKMLFLDVDHDAMNEINHDQQTWSELETVPTPLRSSAEYREQGQLHRRWMSRRWLFNVLAIFAAMDFVHLAGWHCCQMSPASWRHSVRQSSM